MEVFNYGSEIFGGTILPPKDATYDLGSAALSWRNAYIDTAIYSTSVVGNWNPSVTSTYTLGTADLGWKTLYIDSTTTGIFFEGTFTGNCIDFTSVAIDHTGSNGPCLIRAGTYASPVSNADADQSGMIRLYSTTSATGTSYDRTIFACAKTTNTKGVCPVAGLAEINAIASGNGPTGVGASQFIAHMNSATAKLDARSLAGTANFYGSWLKVTSEVGAVAASGSVVAPVWLDNQMNGTTSGEEYAVYITSGTTVDAVFGFEATGGGGSWTNLFYFDSTCSSLAPISGASLMCLLDTTQYYIPLSTIATGLGSAGSIIIQPTADTDDYFTFATVSGIPTIYGTGSYVRIGDAATSGLLSSEDDLFVSGKCHVQDDLITQDYIILLADTSSFQLGLGQEVHMRYQVTDADAKVVVWTMDESDDSGNNVPAWVFGEETNVAGKDLGLLDELVQPALVMVDNAGKYAAVTNATSTGTGVAVLTTATAGTFTNAVVGDIVRVTAGTNATTGWYWITTATDQYNITLDRSWCTGAVSGGTIVVDHSFTMLSSQGICTRITDGAPTDSSVDIDRDGWIIDNVGNNQLYHRSQSVWRALQNSIITVEAHTENDTLTLAESGSVHTNLGDSDGVDLKLPASATAGTYFTFSLQVAQTLDVVIDAAAGKFYINGTISTDDGGNDLKVTADDEGESITLMSDGAGGWFVTAVNGTWTVSQP